MAAEKNATVEPSPEDVLKLQIQELTKRAEEAEASVQQLMGEVDQLTTRAETAEGSVQQLTDQVKTLTDDAQKAEEVYKKAIDDLVVRVVEAETLVEELSSQIDKVEDAGVKVFPTVKLGKDTYSLVAEPGTVPPYGHIRAEDVTNDSNVLKHLIKIKASCLERVNTKKA